MSRPTPAALLSAMSMMTTSASSLSAIARATVAPTLPAPPTTVTFLFIVGCLLLQPDFSAPGFLPLKAEATESGRNARGFRLQAEDLHVCNDRVGELRRLDLGRVLGETREVVGDPPARDRPVHAADDQVGGLAPSQVSQH